MKPVFLKLDPVTIVNLNQITDIRIWADGTCTLFLAGNDTPDQRNYLKLNQEQTTKFLKLLLDYTTYLEL